MSALTDFGATASTAALNLVDLQRPYYFSILIDATNDLAEESFFSSALNSAASLSINLFAKEVTIPPQAIKFSTVPVGPMTVPVPSAIDIPDISAEYLEVDGGFVLKFFRAWQQKVFASSGPSDSSITRNLYTDMNPVGKITRGLNILYYSTVAVSGTVLRAPVTVIRWENVYPKSVIPSSLDKSGTGYSTVKVVFSRMLDLRPANFKAFTRTEIAPKRAHEL